MTEKLLLGLDIGSSSIKASLLHAESGALLASATSPEREMKIDSPQPGWAEQHPETWWEHVVRATHQLLPSLPASYEILGIGISYQMHGLVLVDRHQTAIHPAITTAGPTLRIVFRSSIITSSHWGQPLDDGGVNRFGRKST